MKIQTLENLVIIIEQELDVKEIQIRSIGRKGNIPMARCMFRYFSSNFLNWPDDRISDWLNQSRVSKYSYLRKHKNSMMYDKSYQIIFFRIFNIITK